MKDRVSFKVVDVTTWETNNDNAYFPNISRCKGNQAIKFGQLIEYNMTKKFLEKPYTKCGGEINLRLFSKK